MYSFIQPTPKPKKGEVSPDPQLVADSVSILPFFIVYILFPLAYCDFYGYLPNSPLFGPIFIFIIVPLLDTFIGLDGFNPCPKIYQALERRWTFSLPTLLWLPTHLAFMYWGVVHALPQTSENNAKQWWGLVFNFGIAAGVAINMSHEMIHKNTWYEHGSGCLVLSLVCYGHFAVEHLDGHHKRVATLEDPASARPGENVYAFLPRSIVGGFISAFHLNFRKCALLWLVTGALALAIANLNRNALSFFFLQGMIGAGFLEVVNYVEHAGLTRSPSEAVNPLHSWNYGSKFQNAFLLNLMRHSDHHASGGRRYQSLRSWPWSPNLPFGYATAILLALVPPLWFKVMNPRIEHAIKIQEQLRKQGKLEAVFTDKWLEEHPFFDDFKEAGWY